MGVRRYRSVAELPEPPPRRRGDPGNLKIAFTLSETCRRLRPVRLPPGVHKSRTLEEAARKRLGWERVGLAPGSAAASSRAR